MNDHYFLLMKKLVTPPLLARLGDNFVASGGSEKKSSADQSVSKASSCDFFIGSFLAPKNFVPRKLC